MAEQINKLLLAAAVVSAAWLIQGNEAGRMSMSTSARATTRLRMMWKANKVQSSKAVEVIRRGMTTEKAMRIYPEFVGLIQESGTHRTISNKGKLRSRAVRQTPAGAKGNSDSDYTGGTNVALARLNDMMLETIEKHDAEDIRCHDYQSSQLLILQEIQEDRKILETLGESAKATKADAYSQKNRYQDMVDTQRGEITKWISQCGTERQELATQYDVATGDLSTMLTVVKMVDCENPVAGTGVLPGAAVLLQCRNLHTGRTYEKLSIRNAEMRRKLASMKHPKVLQLLSDALEAPGDDKFQYRTGGPIPATQTPAPDMAEEKCSLANSTKCPDLRERFMNIQGGIEDTVMQIKHFQSNHDLRCQHVEETMTAELDLYVLSVDRYTGLEKRAVETMGEYDLQMTEKDRQYSETSKELTDELQNCDKIIKELDNEHCALEKIRGELLKMESLPNDVTDCEVTEWAPEECSVTCGGGARYLTRMVTVHTDGGHHCPALKAQQNCNTHRCPLDCTVDEWSGWGPCSAFCNGGVEERLRKITQHNTPGGDACPQTSETNECNLDNCDADCELYDWSTWSPTCTKVCGGGRQSRFKHLKQAEKGQGTCPVFHDVKRFNTKPCNTQACDYDTTHKMVCDAKIDVILLLDGSGSIDQASFETLRGAAAKLVSSMGPEVNVGALQFGGPSVERSTHPEFYKNYYVCMGSQGAYDRGWDKPNDWDHNEVCGMKWAAQLSNDKADAAAKINAAPWLKADYTMTHVALKLASEEMKFGRADAQSLIIVFTDGVPASATRTHDAAAEVMKKARLMWVPVDVPISKLPGFDDLASEPTVDNVISVSDINSLKDTETVDKIITNFCPIIKYETTTAAASR